MLQRVLGVACVAFAALWVLYGLLRIMAAAIAASVLGAAMLLTVAEWVRGDRGRQLADVDFAGAADQLALAVRLPGRPPRR
jgi:dolichol kinase